MEEENQNTTVIQLLRTHRQAQEQTLMSMNACLEETKKIEGSTVTGVQDKMLKEKFLGMLLDTATDPARLGEEGYRKVEVLGGNHTREALQSLLLKGALSCSVVKVNIYEPLPVSAALAIGYQHNAILQEKRRPLQFIEKVRLMRYCRLSDSMTKDELLKWKEMLVVVFRTKDRRKLMNMYAKHMHMAQLPDHIWTKVMRAADKVGQVSEKFFRPMMRLVNNEKTERCLDTLIDIGLKEFKNQVKQYIEEGCVRSKKKASKETNEEYVELDLDQSEEVQQPDEQYKPKYISLKDNYENLKREFDKVVAENKELSEELARIKSETVDTGYRTGKKRLPETTIEEFSKGQTVEAFWKDENGEEWLKAEILKVNKNGLRVRYAVDSGIATVPHSWVRMIN